MLRIVLLFVACFCTSVLVKAVNPGVVNYTPDDYSKHPINYDVTIGKNGLLYAANAYGVLEFNGKDWRSIGIQGGKSPLSLAYDNNGTVYVGADRELGFLKKDSSGYLQFESLMHLVPKDVEMNRMNYTVYHQGKVYFASLSCVLVFDGKSIEVIKPTGGKFFFLGKAGDDLLIMENQKGIGLVKGTQIDWLTGVLEEIFLKGAKKLGEGSYYFFAEKNIFKYDNGSMEEVEVTEDFFKDNQILDAKDSKEGVVITTDNHGVYILDQNFKIKLHVSNQNGLTDNFVSRCYIQNSGDIWLATSKGISMLKYSVPFEYIDADQGVEGMGYASVRKGDTLFLGTAQGLYYSPGWFNNKNAPFYKIEGVKTFVYDLIVLNGQVLCADQSEVYQISGGKAKRISTGGWYGAWKFVPAPGRDDLVLVGTYTNMEVYQYVNGSWQFRNSVEGLNVSGRMFEFDTDGVLWIVQGIEGLFRIELDSDYRKVLSIKNYVDEMNKSADFFNDIVKINGKLKVASWEGIYAIENSTPVIDEEFSDFGEIGRLRSINPHTMYTIFNDRPVVLEYDNGKWKRSNNMLNSLKGRLVGSAEFICELDPTQLLVATQDGFVIYKKNHEAVDLPRPIISEVEVIAKEKKDSLILHSSDHTFENEIVLEFVDNSVRFTFTTPYFDSKHESKYLIQLNSEESEDSWKELTGVQFKEYTNLREGEYSFEIMSIVNGQTSEATKIQFKVLPPWYRTTSAYAAYALVMVILSLASYKNLKRKLEKQKVVLEAEKEKELGMQEKLHEAEKLQLELNKKDDELAYLALNFTQKKELMANLKKQLNELSKKLSDHNNVNELRSLARTIQVEKEDEKNWQKFKIHFDQTHDNFFVKLRELDSRMNESTLLMCSYIRMGKSNKEIADLLNISISGVEKRKYRLKKKWELSDDQNITDYLKEM